MAIHLRVRRRKPFDVFRLRLEGRYGDDKRIIDNVLGYGLLFGKNIIKGNNGMLVGIFQHFDYWNNKVFELGSLGFGAGDYFKNKNQKTLKFIFRFAFRGGAISG